MRLLSGLMALASCFLPTQNLLQNPDISLLIIEDESKTRNQFARKRIIWRGRSEGIIRDSELFKLRNVIRDNVLIELYEWSPFAVFLAVRSVLDA